MQKKNSPCRINFVYKIIPTSRDIRQGKNGSVLIVALLILAMMLISALSLALVAVRERKASIGDVDSNKAFQNADTGIERVMQLITRGNFDYIGGGGTNSLITNIPTFPNGQQQFRCLPSGYIEDNSSSENFVVTLEKTNVSGTGLEQINCNNSELVSNIEKIKSVGSSSSTKRAVEVLVSNKITKLLMHFDNNFDDVSYSDHNASSSGSVTFSVDTPTGDFGSNSALFNSAAGGSYLTVDSSDDWDFQNHDFSIETRIKFIPPPAPNSNPNIINHWNEDGNKRGFKLYYEQSSGRIIFNYSTDGNGGSSSRNLSSDDARIIENGNWHHVLINRKGGKLYFFIDGELRGNPNFSTSSDLIYYDSATSLKIGAVLNGGTLEANSQFFGNMDELRITKGVARYTENFNTKLWTIPYEWNN
ncbi:MAG TPA: LamG domain-containing protein [Candidatus Moranbacteria bacterium]|nr:LamG domain-containing protein [Candidatus Moranbacteria bacterium]